MKASPYRPQDKSPAERAECRARRITPSADETLLMDLNAAEQAAIINLIRVTSDEWADVEDGANAPRGTLEALAERIRSVR